MHRLDIPKMPPDQGEDKEERPAPPMFYKQKARKPETKRRPAAQRVATVPVQTSGSGAWWFALGLEGVWLGMLALLWWPIATDGSLELSYDSVIRFAALGLFGTVIIFAGAARVAAAKRSEHMAASLGRLAQRLTEPVGAAANEVVHLGTAVRQEIESLNNSLEGALKRVGMLEAIVREKASQIDGSAGNLERRVTALDQLLTAERAKIEAMTSQLDGEISGLADKIEARTKILGEATKAADARLREAETLLARQAKAVATTAEEALGHAREAGKVLEAERAKLTGAGETAFKRAEALSARYREQTEALAQMSKQLGEEEAKLKGLLEGQKKLLAETSTLAEAQAKRIDAALAKGLAELDRATTAMAERTEASGNAFADRLAAVKRQSEESARALAEAAERAREITDGVAQALSRQAGAARATLEAEAERTKDVLSALSAESEQALSDQLAAIQASLRKLADRGRSTVEDQAEALKGGLNEQVEALRGALASEIDELRSRLAELTVQASAHFRNEQQSLKSAIAEVDASMLAAAERLGKNVEGVHRDAEEIRAAITTLSGEIERRMAQLPVAAQESAAAVRGALNDQFTALSRMAEEAVENARELGRALRPFVGPDKPARTAAPREPDEPYPQVWSDKPARREAARRPARPSREERARSERPRFDPDDDGLAMPRPRTEEEGVPPVDAGARSQPSDRRPGQAGRRLGWSSILANADRLRIDSTPREPERPRSAPREDSYVNGRPPEAGFRVTSADILETLQELSIDISRVIEAEPPSDVIESYLAGDRNAFVRRLAHLGVRTLAPQIGRFYRDNLSFRDRVDRYLEEFERLVDEAGGFAPDNLLAETYLTSQAGKVYMLLKECARRVG